MGVVPVVVDGVARAIAILSTTMDDRDCHDQSLLIGVLAKELALGNVEDFVQKSPPGEESRTQSIYQEHDERSRR